MIVTAAAFRALILILTVGRIESFAIAVFGLVTQLPIFSGVFWTGWLFGLVSIGSLIAYADWLMATEWEKPPRVTGMVDKDIGHDQDRHRFW